MAKAEIPKVIHYCWFGDGQLGHKESLCIASWKKFLPSYEIRRWDEANFDVHCCAYVREAYEAKKWAFVSDYARFKILFEEGGLYFDTDVEIIRPLDDIIAAGPFMGLERDAPGFGNNAAAVGEIAVAPGLGLSANPGLGLYRAVLESYDHDHFVGADGEPVLTTVVTRTTGIMEAMGLENTPGIQRVGGVNVYPSEYFNPKEFLTGKLTITGNTRTIHHFSMSWLTPWQRTKRVVGSFLRRVGLR